MLFCAGLLQGCTLVLTAQRSSVPCASVRDSQLPRHLGASVVRNSIPSDLMHLSADSAAASTSGTESLTNLSAAPSYQRAGQWSLSPLVFRGAMVSGLMELLFFLSLTAALSLGTLRAGTLLRPRTLPQRLKRMGRCRTSLNPETGKVRRGARPRGLCFFSSRVDWGCRALVS